MGFNQGNAGVGQLKPGITQTAPNILTYNPPPPQMGLDLKPMPKEMGYVLGEEGSLPKLSLCERIGQVTAEIPFLSWDRHHYAALMAATYSFFCYHATNSELFKELGLSQQAVEKVREAIYQANWESVLGEEFNSKLRMKPGTEMFYRGNRKDCVLLLDIQLPKEGFQYRSLVDSTYETYEIPSALQFLMFFFQPDIIQAIVNWVNDLQFQVVREKEGGPVADPMPTYLKADGTVGKMESFGNPLNGLFDFQIPGALGI